MTKNIFEFSDYKKYLLSLVSEGDYSVTELSQAIGCQRSYLSRVINSNLNLTSDHVFKLNQILALDELQSQALYLMVEYERSGLSDYKEKITKEIATLRNKYLDLKNKVQSKEVLIHEMNSYQSIYYSSWIYSAIHMMTSIKNFQTASAIADHLKLNETLVLSVLEILKEFKLVEKKDNQWHWRTGDTHLAKEHSLNAIHQQNWMHKALTDVHAKTEDSIHYSIIQTISKEDYQLLSQKIVQWISQYSKISTPSQPENLVCFRVDFFKV